jgi:glycerate kinase
MQKLANGKACQLTITILVAPSGFKECLSVKDVTDAIAKGIARVLPDAVVLRAPLVDGGEGTTESLVDATGGQIHRRRVTGPTGAPIESRFGILGGDGPRTAIVEMAAAAGLSLVPKDSRDPSKTTSYGVGELIAAALELDVERILIGCGDSGVNDGGAGMVQALGARLLDADGNELPFGGREVVRLAKIDVGTLHPKLRSVEIDAAVNWHNVLLGKRGVARVFGPQKGAAPAQVIALEAGLEAMASRILADLGVDVAHGPGTGASGGLGAAIAGILRGRLHSRYDILMRYLNFEEQLATADLVVTAEGMLDGQTPYGKIPAEVARRARASGIPTIVLAGAIGKGFEANFRVGVDAIASAVTHPCTLEEAMRDAYGQLMRAAEDATRMVRVGIALGGRQSTRRRRSAAMIRNTPIADPQTGAWRLHY